MNKILWLLALVIGMSAASVEQFDESGQVYKADVPYVTWLTTEWCGKLGGKPCLSFACAGAHYVNEFCCCNIMYNRERPAFESAILAAYDINPSVQSTYFTMGSGMGMMGGSSPFGMITGPTLAPQAWLYANLPDWP